MLIQIPGYSRATFTQEYKNLIKNQNVKLKRQQSLVGLYQLEQKTNPVGVPDRAGMDRQAGRFQAA
jgi:hypothetical protein